MKLYTLLLGSALANYDTYVIPIDDSKALEWRDPDNLLEFLEKETIKIYYLTPLTWKFVGTLLTVKNFAYND